MSDEDIRLWVIVGAATACIVYYLFKTRQAASQPIRSPYHIEECLGKTLNKYPVPDGYDSRRTMKQLPVLTDEVKVRIRMVGLSDPFYQLLRERGHPYEACKKDVAFQRFMKKVLQNQ